MDENTPLEVNAFQYHTRDLVVTCHNVCPLSAKRHLTKSLDCHITREGLYLALLFSVQPEYKE